MGSYAKLSFPEANIFSGHDSNFLNVAHGHDGEVCIMASQDKWNIFELSYANDTINNHSFISSGKRKIVFSF